MDPKLMQEATQGLAAKPMPKGKKKIHMRITPTDNAGFHVENSAESDDGTMPSKQSSHVFENVDGLHQHITKHYGAPKGKKAKKESKDEKSAAKGKESPAEELEEAMESSKMGS